MADLPFMKFFVTEWLNDPAARGLSLAARGLWLEMLCLMHRSYRRGYLCAGGSVPSLEQLARMTGSSTEELTRLLTELLDSGIAAVSADGLYYSPRMVKETQFQARCAEAGKRGGGNPNLVQEPLKVHEPIKSASKVHPKVRPKVHPKVGPNGASCSSSSLPSGLLFPSEEEEEVKQEEVRTPGVGGVGEGGVSRPGKRGPPVNDPLWVQFWNAYPRKQAKQDALKAWAQVGPTGETLRLILAALAWQKPLWGQSEEKFTPLPASYLRGRRWLDERPREKTTRPTIDPARMASEAMARARAARKETS